MNAARGMLNVNAVLFAQYPRKVYPQRRQHVEQWSSSVYWKAADDTHSEAGFFKAARIATVRGEFWKGGKSLTENRPAKI